MRYLVLCFLAVVLVAGVNAQNDEDLNWCYDPDIWGDGRCNDPDPYVSDWFWTVGWYRANYEAGRIDSMPDWAQEPDEPAPLNIPAGCYQPSVATGTWDTYYTGVPNQHGNIIAYESKDGSCSGVPLLMHKYWIMIDTRSMSEAVAFCMANTTPAGNATPVFERFYNLPNHVWSCWGYSCADIPGGC